jgi:short-subunit dehydrogenase
LPRSARTPERLEKVAAEVRQRGVRALVVPCDVNDTAQIEQLVFNWPFKMPTGL